MSDDPTIDQKKRARRRLVGAAALALLAAIVLPIVMDSEPKPSGQEIQIRIPNRDSDSLVAHVIPGRPATAPLPKNVEPQSPVVPVSPEARTTSGAEAAKIAPAAAKPAAAVVGTPLVTKKEVIVAKSEPAAKTEVAHAEAALEGKDSGLWIVQLGAYQNAANVKQLAGKLKAMGISSYAEKFDLPQGQRTRVRAGPFKSHEDADKARLRIKKIGVDGTVSPTQ